MSEEGAYVLGVDADELARLRFQHAAWTERAFSIWRRAGFGAGQRLLDLGCGPGYTTFELARIVGETGSVVAHDQSAGFLEWLTAERDRVGLPWIEPSLGPAEELELEDASLDGVYARWLFCWPPDPGAILERVARALKPGGAIAMQEYLDWAAMKLVPHSDAFVRARECCMKSWEVAGGDIDVAARMPELAEAAGLTVEVFEPIARTGRVGSLEWRWATGFLRSYLPKLVEAGIATEDVHRDLVRELDRRDATGEGWILAPLMSDVVLRR